ncbi:ATP-dependent Clp protease proteolytic subunit [Flavonifractor plautii]|uniref:ATP-dependent Clp protease proteolytic subunit n=1 Tax=Flavonifractor plautii TaxID=292800 RepID=UPI0018AA1236|nr:ATP-dependent Clp protease proteolytic subunit [Flavonifractor plautii]
MMENPCGYYDIEIDIEKALIDGGMVNDIFYLKDLKQRKLFLSEDVNQYSVGDIVKNILQYNREDYGVPSEGRKPILLYVSSNGGEVDAGFELIDAIRCSKTPVYTINLGYQYSMGFLIGLAGHRRYAMEHSKFLLHDGSNFIYNSGAKAQDQMEFNRKVEDRVKQYILSRSKLASEEYDSKLRVEWYMFSDEAKEKGFVDYIIGKDCDIDEII